MPIQGLPKERRKLALWLEGLKPGAVIKKLVNVYSSKGSRDGNAYFKVIETKPKLKVKILHIQKHICLEGWLAGEGDVVVIDDEWDILELRPVGADEYREMLMSMFT